MPWGNFACTFATRTIGKRGQCGFCTCNGMLTCPCLDAASMPRAASTDSLGGEVEAASARTADAAGMAVHDPPADGSSGALRAVESSTPPLHQADSSGLQHDGKPPAHLDGRNGFGGVHAGFGEQHLAW